MTDALSAAFPWLQEASDTGPRHFALRPIAWEHAEACGCAECRLSKIKRAATRAAALGLEWAPPTTKELPR